MINANSQIREKDMPQDTNWESSFIPEAIVYSLVKPWGKSNRNTIHWVRYMRADVLHGYNVGVLSLKQGP